MKVNIHYSKTNVPRGITAAESGEEAMIARNGKAVVNARAGHLTRFSPHQAEPAASVNLPHSIGISSYQRRR